MHSALEPYRRAAKHLIPITLRHALVLVNGVIFIVVVLLYLFSDHQAAIFLGIILFANTLVGIIQDFQAMVSLERLQLLTAARALRLGKDGGEESVLPESLEKGDTIRVRRGDQIPCDGAITISKNVEVSDALITGESDTFPKRIGDAVSAGGIVTSGSADIRVDVAYRGSRIAQMSEGVKTYRASRSPIERSVGTIIMYASIVLVAVIIVVVLRGTLSGATSIAIVREVGALASAIVPQGLIVITTLLFAFGAAGYSRRQVLFQEINAAEKLGRIKNLCMDKTGTLTDNKLLVETMRVFGKWNEGDVKRLASAYIFGSEDSSQTISAVGDYVGARNATDTIVEALPFSSWRQYGAAKVEHSQQRVNLLVGALDIFLPFVSSPEERREVERAFAEYKESGKRILAIAEVHGSELPKSLSGHSLSIVAFFVFKSGLREGIKEAIGFFQDRGVMIRILTGDNPETARAVARSAGVLEVDRVVTGAEMSTWSDEDFQTKSLTYRIFARVLPEQKVKIVQALKRDGFTAMVGDGANDALAIRTADLGIAMWDGAQATRQLAAVILMNNSFTALPGAVRLADSFIQHLEIFASIYLYQSFLGLFFFTMIALFGYSFPFTPLNISPINYFSVGLPGILIGYWALRANESAPASKGENFIRRVSIFPLYSALIGAVGVTAIFLFTRDSTGAIASNTLFAVAFIVLGLMFLMCAPRVFHKQMKSRQWIEIASLILAELVMFGVLSQFPLVWSLFEIQAYPAGSQFLLAFVVILAIGIIQYALARRLGRTNTSPFPGSKSVGL